MAAVYLLVFAAALVAATRGAMRRRTRRRRTDPQGDRTFAEWHKYLKPCIGKTAEGAQALFVYSNTEVVNLREGKRLADREYRLWVAGSIGGGHPLYFEWQP